jgi:hypothetical protein
MKFQTWADAALGVWLLALPLAIGHSSLGLMVAEQILPGVFLIATAAWILIRRVNRLRVTWLQALDGLWLIVGSFVLLFNNLPHAAVNALAAGLLTLALSMIASWELTRRPNIIG